MADKPTTAAAYAPEQVALVRATCLYLATKLGDLMDDLVIIGGLVPSLLINQEGLPEGEEAHVGTMDLDVGLTVALLDEGRYTAFTERLRRAGFSPDENEDGNAPALEDRSTSQGHRGLPHPAHAGRGPRREAAEHRGRLRSRHRARATTRVPRIGSR